MANPGGAGSESFGDPMGGGGPIQVVRARAIQGQLVRVVFNQEPVHVSAAGLNDALNPANYLFDVLAGQATSPLAMAVESTMVVPTTLAVGDGGATDERGFDVHTDRALIIGITYAVTVHNVEAASGGALGSPFTAPFPGVVRLRASAPPQRRLDLTDLQNSPFDGALVVDDSGDLAAEGGAAGLRKRLLRRAATTKNAFAHLPGYGAGLVLKRNAGPAELASIRSDLRAQALQEPEVSDAKVTISQLTPGVVVVSIVAQTKKGAIVTATAQVSPSGVVVPS